MDATMIDQHLENIDRRLTRLEQILPTLATKGELRVAITDAVAPLATKAELRAAIEPLATKVELRAAIEPLATKVELRAAIEPLATKEDLHRAIDEASETLRRHMTILIEHQDSKLELIAEHVLKRKSSEE